MPNKKYNNFHELSNMNYIKKNYQFKYIFINFTFD